MHTQIDRFFKNFFEKIYPLTCLNREAKKWGYFEKKIKSPFTCLKWETILGGVFEKIFENIFSLSFLNSEQLFAIPNEKVCKTKNLLSIHRTERREWFGIIKL